jgi:hypothetical protein
MIAVLFFRSEFHLPAKLREQPDGGLLDKLVFGVGVGGHVLAFDHAGKYPALDLAGNGSKGIPLKFRLSRRSGSFWHTLLLTKLG